MVGTRSCHVEQVDVSRLLILRQGLFLQLGIIIALLVHTIIISPFLIQFPIHYHSWLDWIGHVLTTYSPARDLLLLAKFLLCKKRLFELLVHLRSLSQTVKLVALALLESATYYMAHESNCPACNVRRSPCRPQLNLDSYNNSDRALITQGPPCRLIPEPPEGPSSTARLDAGRGV